MPFRRLPLSFFDLLERPTSFLLPFSHSLSFPVFLTRFARGRPGETGAASVVADGAERHLLLVLLEEEEDEEDWTDFFTFFLGRCRPVLGVVLALGVGTGGSGGRGGGGVSSSDG